MLSSPKYTNLLIHETSPYLLQHAHNPVNWHSWSDEALQKAQQEDKLVLISIGYAACHWCHVMEHESFEDEMVASVMNNHYICIKVDREERPDIDHLYMDAVQMMTGRGGWPLNCFALPDGRPIFGGTYFPKENWVQVLLALHQQYLQKREKVILQAENIASGLQTESPVSVSVVPGTFTPKKPEDAYQSLTPWLDNVWGGSQGYPKFPMPGVYSYILNYYHHTSNGEALTHLELTLRKMSIGGIYDQTGGGFARYSTDERWFAPHFEKMLYDNAQLVSLYCHSFRKTAIASYERVIRESLAFVDRELTSAAGGFYSSLDADSEGEEGKFYVWRKSEIDNLLGRDAAFFCQYFHISEMGNWEQSKNILYADFPPEELTSEEQTLINRGKEKLLQQRALRTRPSLDTKVLCSWNALMLVGYLDAYMALGDAAYLFKAQQNAAYLEKNHVLEGGKILRCNQHGKTIQGFLDDYSYTALAFIKLYQVTTEEKWVKLALHLVKYVLNNFRDPHSGMFFYTSNEDNTLIVRKIEISDQVIPASNSVMAHVLYLLGKIFELPEYQKIAHHMVQAVAPSILQQPWYHACWAELLTVMSSPTYEFIVTGPGAIGAIHEIGKYYLPEVLVCGSTKESDLPLMKNRYKSNETWFYVCSEGACQLPVRSMEEALEMLKTLFT